MNEWQEYQQQHAGDPVSVPEYMTAEAQEREQQEQTEAQNAERVTELKAGILEQIRQGNSPQGPLYAALECIGILTHDSGWTNEGQAALDSIYGDIAQESLTVNSAAVEAARLEARKLAYYDKIKRSIKSDLNKFRDLEAFARTIEQMITDLPEIDTGSGTHTAPTKAPKENDHAREIISALARAGYTAINGEYYGLYTTRAGEHWEIWYTLQSSCVRLLHRPAGSDYTTACRQYALEELPALFDHTQEPAEDPQPGKYPHPADDPRPAQDPSPHKIPETAS